MYNTDDLMVWHPNSDVKDDWFDWDMDVVDNDYTAWHYWGWKVYYTIHNQDFHQF